MITVSLISFLTCVAIVVSKQTLEHGVSYIWLYKQNVNEILSEAVVTEVMMVDVGRR
jgi:hypothetical protein